MRKILSILLLISIVLSLCACSAVNTNADNTEATEYFWRVETKSYYPLGLSGTISGVAANDERIFICGSNDDSAYLASMDYAIADGKINLSDNNIYELPSGSRAISIGYGAEKFYLVLATSNDFNDNTEYVVETYSPDGLLVNTFPISINDSDVVKSIIVMNDGGFWIRGLHNIRFYTADGTETENFVWEREDFCSSLIINDKATFQTIDYNSHKSKLNNYDSANGKLQSVECNYELSVPDATCQSVVGNALINNGNKLLSIDSEYNVSQIADWDELIGAGTNYRHVCQLNEKTFILIPQNPDEIYLEMQGIEPEASGELVLLTMDYVPDNRATIQIACYGQVSSIVDSLENQYSHYSPDYKVECIDYGDDSAGLTRLMKDITTSDKIDIVLSNGYSIDSSSGFVDLYPYIDNDSSISRETILPQVLEGTERNGKLTEIWGGFTINALEAFGELSEEPTPLELANCQSYLESVGYTEPMYSDWMTKNELLHYLMPGILRNTYDSQNNSYNFDNDYIRVLLELCSLRPDAYSDENPYSSEILGYIDLQPDYINNLITTDRKYRLFDGNDGGDNFTSLLCDYRSSYMIPDTCANKDNAWGFLRILLSEECQMKQFNQRRVCYPSNVNALDAVLSSYNSEKTYDTVYKLIEHATLYTWDSVTAESIFTESVQPYLYGDSDLNTVLKIAQGKINIFSAEHSD